MDLLQDSPQRRLNPLTGEWVLVSPHRTQRPWQGQVDGPRTEQGLSYDPNCYLCPGNPRAGSARNPDYSSTFVFDNDYPALLPKAYGTSSNVKDLIVAEPERGICRVACFSPRHDLTLSRMSTPDIAAVVQVWRDQLAELGSRDFIHYVQIFENRGAMMGASNPHPHCQIWATSSIPNEPTKEHLSMERYLRQHGTCMLCEYIDYEADRDRLVFANASFIAVVPFWAIWPFEILVVAQRHVADLTALAAEELQHLGEILKKVTACYDQLFRTSFPYSMGFHQQPTDGRPHPHVHLHGHFYPPLLRSAEIRKFMVGFEMLATPQRDITPEAAAKRLRAVCSGEHGIDG
jgi:UDPglucose--hexose-1-phosphate uridylyltransferase